MTQRPFLRMLAFATLLASGGLSTSSHAQTYPVRTVRIVVPFSAGGNTDATARPLAAKLAEALGHPFIVENRPGANTIVGAEIVAKAPADGHTLLMAAQNTLCINPFSYKSLPYDPKRDFAPIALLTDYNFVLVGRADGPKTIPELVALAKANPYKLSHASIGEGSSGHLQQILFESMAGIKMTHVPYKGNVPMMTDLLGGNVDLALMGLASIQSQVKSGRVRLLAVGSEKRLPELPDLPTFNELGYTGFITGSWFAMVTQAAVPRPIVMRLNQEINKALQSPELKAPLEAQKVMLGNGTPEDLAKRIAFESARWEKVVKSINLSMD